MIEPTPHPLFKPKLSPVDIMGRVLKCARCHTPIDVIDLGGKPPDRFVCDQCLVPVKPQHG